jgi:hypothetical protein
MDLDDVSAETFCARFHKPSPGNVRFCESRGYAWIIEACPGNGTCADRRLNLHVRAAETRYGSRQESRSRNSSRRHEVGAVSSRWVRASPYDRHTQAVLNQLARDLTSHVESFSDTASSTQNLIDSRLRRQTIYGDHQVHPPCRAGRTGICCRPPEQTRRSALKGLSPCPETPMTGR